MNIMIFDVPAESGGALSILHEVYEEAVANEDKTINWTFVVSKPDLKETENIKILRFPWIKKSWGHRLYFDNFIAQKVVKKNKPDLVLSLQNIIIPRIKCRQVLYVHQSLPFVEHRFSFKDNKTFWIYQNIIGRKIIKSIQKADRVIVQTDWMKKACVKKSVVLMDKIEVIPPKINITINKYFKPTNETLTTFFYPGNGMEYKNHGVIVDALSQMKKDYVGNYEVILTLDGNENEYISRLFKRVNDEKLPIKFRGSMPREDVFNMYTKSILIFPSYIETFGLPLLEARMHKGIILAADTPFANEVLDKYKNAYFFRYSSHTELVRLITKLMSNELKYVDDISDVGDATNIKTGSIINTLISNINGSA